MGSVKDILKDMPFYPAAWQAYRRYVKRIPSHPLQKVKTDKNYELKRLGTSYGGWTFVDNGDLTNSTIISAGLGEDGSFDVEFAKAYNARVIVVDPTPRAIRHFDAIVSRLGSAAVLPYSRGGAQPPEAYNLQGLTTENFTLVPKALWNVDTKLKFFEPVNPAHVSHSIVNYQNNYSTESRHLEVEATTMSNLLNSLDLAPGDIKLMKLDIEGAEIEVISDFLADGILPKQILVEFDELNAPSPKGFERISQVHRLLISHGYKCIHTDRKADFLFVRQTS